MIIGNKPNRRSFAEHADKSFLVKFSSMQNDPMDFPICERCERIALSDKNSTYTCPVCGHSGRVRTRVRDYLVSEKYLPEVAREAAVFADLKR